MIENENKHLFRNGIHRSCVIFDLGGFALRNMDYSFMKFMIHMLQNYYPESMGVCLILNSPWLFSGCWAVLKHWIDPRSQEKIKFIASAQLSEFIDPTAIPKSLGGSEEWEYKYEYPLATFAGNSA